MSDLATWLHAQLDEDERVARAEVDARRQLLDLHRQIVDADWPAPGHCLNCWADEDYLPWPCPTMRLIALPYADRKGYREEWRP